MKKNVSLSNANHIRLCKVNAKKANSAKSGTANAFYAAKVEYHKEVLELQSKRGKILPSGERKILYLHHMRNQGVSPNFKESR